MAASESEPNPFSAPIAEAADVFGDLAANGPHATLGLIAKRVFLEWEKLRVLYNGLLIVVTLLLGSSHLNTIEFWGAAVVGGVICNVCFFLGPIVETYVTWLGFRTRWLRWLFFVSGTLFTMAGAAAAMFAIALPNQ